MGKFGYNVRRDANHADIVKVLRAYGAYVIDIAGVKNAFDILVAHKGRLFCVEIKDGDKTPSQRKLTHGEEICKVSLESVGVPYYVVESEAEAIELLNSK